MLLPLYMSYLVQGLIVHYMCLCVCMYIRGWSPCLYIAHSSLLRVVRDKVRVYSTWKQFSWKKKNLVYSMWLPKVNHRMEQRWRKNVFCLQRAYSLVENNHYTFDKSVSNSRLIMMNGIQWCTEFGYVVPEKREVQGASAGLQNI